MSDIDKSKPWAPFLLGVLTGAMSREKLADVKSILATSDGPLIHAVDEDGDNLLITVDVKIVSDDEVPRIHEYEPEPE